MVALWVVDNQPAKRLALERETIVNVIRELGHAVVETIYDPASGRFPTDLDSVFAASRPMILRGSVGFAAWAHAHWAISPGAFRSELLRPSAYLPAYGEPALNSDAIIITYAEFDTRRAEFEKRLGGMLFVKPAEGGKLLSGTVLEPGRSLFDAHYASHRRWSELPADFRLLLARVHTVFAEWRFVIAGANAVAGSQYKKGSVWESQRGAPEGAEALADRVAKHPWRPADVFIADIAQTEEGFRLLELNTFGTAGLYDCDLKAIVQAVSAYAP
jgi:hypothetical protein